MPSDYSAARTRQLLQQLEGITVALATPLTADAKLDALALERLIERALSGGAACLFPLGWMGEQPLLRDETRREVMVETCALARGRVPVRAGISENSLERALQQARAASEAGADCILSTPPYAYDIPQSHVVHFFKELAAQSRMPVVIYQNGEVGVQITEDTLHELSYLPGVVGVKASMPYHTMQRSFARTHRPGEFAVMSGDEYLYGPALFLGMRHFTMGGPGNLCPGWCVRMYDAALAGEWHVVQRMQQRLLAFCDALFASHSLTPYAVVKCALEHLGLCERHITSPHVEADDTEAARIAAVVREYRDVVELTPSSTGSIDNVNLDALAADAVLSQRPGIINFETNKTPVA
jgi:dihydrodipicolinate synthase/N-acetylneuraminate lyase